MTVRQIENALALLDFFAERQEPATLAEIQRHFGWPRSSAYNILQTLVGTGYMYDPARRGGYYPTRRWVEIAQRLADADPEAATLSQLLSDLADRTGETAVLAGPAGEHAVYLDVVEAASPVRYAAHAGMRLPLHASASGRALLALYPPEQRRRILSKIRYQRYGTNALMSAAAVEAEIAASHTRGWFQSLDEYDADLAAVAVPVQSQARRLAVVVAGPLSRLGPRIGEVAGLLIRQAGAHLTGAGA